MKRYLLPIACLIVVVLLFSLVSASWISDLWSKITGRVAGADSVDVAGEGEVKIGVSGTGPEQGSDETLTPVTEKKPQSCCFCAYDGKRDTASFLNVCEDFFNGSYNRNDRNFRCDIREKVADYDWESKVPELLSRYQCAKPLYLYHAGHGPICGEIKKMIQVCASNSPSCDIDFKSGSCLSFNDLSEVEKHFKNLQKELGPEISITSCGNRLYGFRGLPDCTLTSIVKVSQKEFSITPGQCKREGELCAPPDGIAYDCINAQGERTTQRCCRNAKNMEKYVEYDKSLGLSFILPGTAAFSAEGATSCPLPRCGDRGISCSIPGAVYECLAPDGSISSQSCCLKDTVGKSLILSNYGEACSLPACVEQTSSLRASCSRDYQVIKCLDKQGKETTQACCGIRDIQGVGGTHGSRFLRSVGFLSSVGENSCDCKYSDSECLINGKPIPSSLSCGYDPAPKGTFCGEYKASVCSDTGACIVGARPQCEKDSDCYKQGRPYCTSFGFRSMINEQKCVKGSCQPDIRKLCKDNTETCLDDDKGASCVRKPSSKPAKKSLRAFFFPEETQDVAA